MDSHISDRALYDDLTGRCKLTGEQVSHLQTCQTCSDLLKVVQSLKTYIDVTEGDSRD
jgi:hypothetical protein